MRDSLCLLDKLTHIKMWQKDKNKIHLNTDRTVVFSVYDDLWILPYFEPFNAAVFYFFPWGYQRKFLCIDLMVEMGGSYHIPEIFHSYTLSHSYTTLPQRRKLWAEERGGHYKHIKHLSLYKKYWLSSSMRTNPFHMKCTVGVRGSCTTGFYFFIFQDMHFHVNPEIIVLAKAHPSCRCLYIRKEWCAWHVFKVIFGKLSFWGSFTNTQL